MLTGLRGVGKTVLLNDAALDGDPAGCGAPARSRPGRTSRCAARCRAALHMAVRELAARHRAPDRIDEFLGVLKAFALRADARRREAARPLAARHRRAGRAAAGPTPATSRSTWSSCSPTPPRSPPTSAPASRCSSTRCRTCGPTTSPRCAPPATSCPSRGAPLIVVGAGLPHLPAVLSASQVVLRAAVPLPAHRPARPGRRRPGAARAGRARGRRVRPTRRSTRCTRRPAATPTSSRPTARPPGTPRRAARSPRTDVRVAAPEAEAELAVGFFGSRYERATPAEREYLRAMAELAEGRRRAGRPPRTIADAPRPQAVVAVAGPGRPDQEGPDLLRRARPDRVHRAALRPVPAEHGRLALPLLSAV